MVAALELGEEVRKQWARTVVDDDGVCLGACVFVLAAGVRRTSAPGKVGLQRLNFEQREFATISRDRAKEKYAALANSVEAYLARMGMPKKRRWDWMALTRLMNSGCVQTTLSNRRNQTERQPFGNTLQGTRKQNCCSAAGLSRHPQPQPLWVSYS